MNAERESLIEAAQVSDLSMAYSAAVAEGISMHEGSWMASMPLGERTAVQIPEAQWRKLAAAICAITGGEVV